MGLFVGDRKAHIFRGDHQPAKVYRGETQIAGAVNTVATGTGSVSFEAPYKASLPSVTVMGAGVQLGTPTPDAPINPEFVSGLISDGVETANLPELRGLPDGSIKDEFALRTGVKTERIKKRILDGTEGWQIYGGTGTVRYMQLPDALFDGQPTQKCVCSHFLGAPSGGGSAGRPDNSVWLQPTATYPRLYIKSDRFTTIEEFRSFLANQKAAGTPVTIWYALATPTTSTLPGQTLHQMPGSTILSEENSPVSGELSVEYYKEM